MPPHDMDITAAPPARKSTGLEVLSNTSAHAADTMVSSGLVVATATASARVLGTPELLEHILTQDVLSAADITRTRQISRFFKAVIENSQSLKRLIFLEPNPKQEIITISGYLARHLRLHNWQDNAYKDEEESGRVPMMVTKLHPAISPPDELRKHRYYPDEFDVSTPRRDWAPGIWRSMFICQPPPTNVVVWYRRESTHDCGEGPFSVFGNGRREIGNTLGSLVDMMNELKSTKDVVRVTLEWIRLSGFVTEKLAIVEVARVEKERVATEAAKMSEGTQDGNGSAQADKGDKAEVEFLSTWAAA